MKAATLNVGAALRPAQAACGRICRGQRGASHTMTGLLLSHAVDRPKSPNQISAVNPHNFAVWKNISQNIQSHTIVRIIENGYQHDSISNIEIPIASWKPPTLEVNGRGHG